MRVILTGKTGYIANMTCDLLNARGHDAQCVSVRNGTEGLSFKGADAIVHCAALVHSKENKKMEPFIEINKNLSVEIAKKAIADGVKHFVFMSTMAVYDYMNEVITKDTEDVNCSSMYGFIKLGAELRLEDLRSDNFKLAILRPPMVYGPGCKGNYNLLRTFAKYSPVVPDTYNRKSLIYIGNLARFICEVLENGLHGTFNIMDGEYISTADMVELICEAHGKKIIRSPMLGKVVKHYFKKSLTLWKAFGTFYYDESAATKLNYYNTREAIYFTEGNLNFRKREETAYFDKRPKKKTASEQNGTSAKE